MEKNKQNKDGWGEYSVVDPLGHLRRVGACIIALAEKLRYYALQDETPKRGAAEALDRALYDE